MSEPERVTCPQCSHEFGISLTAAMRDEQRLTVVIRHDNPMLSAKTLHGTIAATERMIHASAREIGGKVHVFVEAMSWANGEATVQFYIVNVKPTEKRR